MLGCEGASQVALVVKSWPADAGDIIDTGGSLGGGDPLEEGPGFSPGESHGQRSLAGYSPPGGKALGTTEAT